MKNYYERLEIDINASSEMVDRAFKLLAKRYHPDTQTETKKAWAEEKFKEINEAYEILSNKEKRSEYDEQLTFEKEQQLQSLYLRNQELEELVQDLKQQLSQKSINSNSSTYTNPYIQRPNTIPTNSQPLKQEFYYTYSIPKRNYLKDFIAFLLTILVITLIGFALWKIPFTNHFLVDLYENNAPIKYIVDIFLNLFQ